MCLTVKEQKPTRTLRRAITVYKVVKRVNKNKSGDSVSAQSWYQNFKWVFGKLVEVDVPIRKDVWGDFKIHEGLRSFPTKDAAFKSSEACDIKRGPTSNRIMVCRIPKGARVWEGKRDGRKELVSDKLIMVRPLNKSPK